MAVLLLSNLLCHQKCSKLIHRAPPLPIFEPHSPKTSAMAKENQQPGQSLLLLPKQSPLPLLLSHLSPLCIPHPRLPVDY
jgi:hypothetical protein